MSREVISRSPGKTDVSIGSRVRELREAAGVSQVRLADAIGVTRRQLQKYECGMNRIGIERLSLIARALSTSMNQLTMSKLDKDEFQILVAKFLAIPHSTLVMRFVVDLESGSPECPTSGYSGR